MWVALAAAAVVFLLGIWVIVTYNRLVAARNRVEEGWAGIDVQLQRRADLVPNLVETVAGYAGHEREVLAAVTRARTDMVAASGPAASGRADDQLEGALKSLFAVAEAYPDLRASANFLALQRELSDLEQEIAFARRYYNAVVEDLNTMIQSFPSLIVANPCGFRPAEYFKAAPDDRAVPSVGALRAGADAGDRPPGRE